MGFLTVVPADPHGGPGRTCPKPGSRGGREFAPGTVWQCDTCGRAWHLSGIVDDQRDGPYDRWEPAPAPGPAPTASP